jgi:hypothetical protein
VWVTARPAAPLEAQTQNVDTSCMGGNGERSGGDLLRWCAAAVLLVALIAGVNLVFLSFFGIGGELILAVGLALIGLPSAALVQLRPKDSASSLNDVPSRGAAFVQAALLLVVVALVFLVLVLSKGF